MRDFRWQQWGILGNERKFDPVDEWKIKYYILRSLLHNEREDSFFVPANACASSRGNSGGASVVVHD